MSSATPQVVQQAPMAPIASSIFPEIGEKSSWKFTEDGDVVLEYGKDLFQALGEIIQSSAFKDSKIIDNAVKFCFPKTALRLRGGSNLTLGGGLYFGAQCTVGQKTQRVYWMIKIQLDGLSERVSLQVNIGGQVRNCATAGEEVSILYIDTQKITHGPIKLSFEEAKA